VQGLLRKADKQVDVPLTIKALSQQLSMSINASIEEVHLQRQSATLQDRATMSAFILGEGTLVYLGKYPYPLKSFVFINKFKKSDHMKVHTYPVEYSFYIVLFHISMC
jgi:hypothetical protein